MPSIEEADKPALARARAPASARTCEVVVSDGGWRV
jgi:hypothetical protein